MPYKKKWAILSGPIQFQKLPTLGNAAPGIPVRIKIKTDQAITGQKFLSIIEGG